MVCNLCGVNESTIHLTEIINNQMVEIHLCESCAQEKGTDFKTHFNVNDLLAGLAEVTKWTAGSEKLGPVKCPDCAMTYEEFAKRGRLGCQGCYTAFESLLTPLIRRIQRSTQHVGKRPARLPKEKEREEAPAGDLRALQQRLRKSIQMEAFEEAADLRDRIKKLEEKLKTKNKKAKSE